MRLAPVAMALSLSRSRYLELILRQVLSTRTRGARDDYHTHEHKSTVPCNRVLQRLNLSLDPSTRFAEKC